MHQKTFNSQAVCLDRWKSLSTLPDSLAMKKGKEGRGRAKLQERERKGTGRGKGFAPLNPVGGSASMCM